MQLARISRAVAIAASLAAVGCGGGGGDGGGGGANQAPSAEAGLDQLVSTGTIVHLDGTASSDPDLDPLIYDWQLTARPLGSAAALVGADTPKPSFAADLEGDYQARLVVSDGRSASAPSTVLVRAAGAPRPIANAGSDLIAVTGQTTVQLDGSASYDPDGSILYYTWVRVSFPAGSTVALNANVPSQPTFVPDKSGEYVFHLQVNDGVRVSDWDEVRVIADTQHDVALVAGGGQSAVVGSVLPAPFVAKVTNAYGLPVRSVAVQFSIASGSGTLSRTTGYTDASGQTSATLTLGTAAGTTTVRAECTTCDNVKSATLGATATPDVPARVVLLRPGDAQVGAAMQLEAQVQDRYGNRITSDTGTRFTVSVSGSAVIASASEGSIVTGAGTSTALVETVNGRVLLSVTDGTAETVAFVSTDTQHNGLAYPGTPFLGSAQQALACSSPYSNTFSFDVSGAAPPSGDATVTLRANGHYSDSWEYIELFLESTTGTSYGKQYDATADLCTQLERAITIPLATLQGYIADGRIGVATRASGDQCIFCSSTYSVAITVEYPGATQAAFY